MAIPTVSVSSRFQSSAPKNMCIHTLKSRFVFVIIFSGLALAACKPSDGDVVNAAPTTAPTPQSAEEDAASHTSLDGLQIANFGPQSIPVQSDEGGPAVNIWASADRSLENTDASLWLDGELLANRAVSGSTVTGAVSTTVLTTPGAYALEIRLSDAAGKHIRSDAVTFNVE
ncbi:hypothetical protein PQS31_14090 [Luteimonas sp BLCC-B24]|uniref:hypothetical protein n=1 Tax=Luteimonas sp. BLCC-B24 TaxID=3025317 RepID=UPI00234D1457|nr:hypothetical protein [Luteimonas sp. BLCC-B24]MDC7807940.1 hypothetical protein [Luteimonas sp. BLCC-B24]